MYTVCYVSERVCEIQSTVDILKNAVAIGPVTRRPFLWLLVRQLVTYGHVTLVAKVTVSVVSTTARFTVDIDLAIYQYQYQYQY